MNIRKAVAASSFSRRLIFVAYLLAVLAATLAPLSGDAYEMVSGLDKVIHVGLFGGLALLLCWNLNSVATRSAIVVFAVTSLFAAFIELVQGQLAYRSGDFWDLLAGAIGALLGIGAARIVASAWIRINSGPE